MKTWAVCLDRNTGRIRWKHSIGGGFKNAKGNNAASPSSVTDGSAVYFLYGTGDFAGFSMEGKILQVKHCCCVWTAVYPG